MTEDKNSKYLNIQLFNDMTNLEHVYLINNIDANDEQIRHDVLNEFNTFCTEMQSITDKYGIDGGDKKDWVRKYMRMRKDAMERNGLEKQFVLHSVYSVGKHLV